MQPVISVIIPTTCEQKRRAQLLRAIDSIKQQQDVKATILLIVNGQRYEKALLEEMRQRADLNFHYLELGSLPNAIAHGRSLVETPYFCFLDDDDVLLENSLRVRLEVLEQDPGLDVAVTNGFNTSTTHQVIRVKNSSRINDDLLGSLVSGNWLASCGGLFRTDTIPKSYFENLIKYYEWTLIAFRCAMERKVRFIDTPTYSINDTPESLSKSSEFVLSDEKIIRLMLDHDIPANVRLALRKKLSGTLHSMSDHLRMKGHYLQAWKYHLKSMCYPGGLAYLTYTRRLFHPKPVSGADST